MRRSKPKAGRDQFRIVGLDGVEIRVSPHPMMALVVAQDLALNAAKPVTLKVERDPVIGPASELYRIDRDQDGVVHTTTLNRED